LGLQAGSFPIPGQQVGDVLGGVIGNLLNRLCCELFCKTLSKPSSPGTGSLAFLSSHYLAFDCAPCSRLGVIKQFDIRAVHAAARLIGKSRDDGPTMILAVAPNLDRAAPVVSDPNSGLDLLQAQLVKFECIVCSKMILMEALDAGAREWRPPRQ
jgi:hypothetical protein